MPNATIIGLDTPAGAYLARLLRARHYAVSGSGSDLEAATSMLATLGADEVEWWVSPFDGPVPSEVYILSSDAPLSEYVAVWPEARLFQATAHDASDGAAARARAAGQFAVAGRLYDHASRLDPSEHWALSVVLAVRDLARGADAPVIADPDSACDLGWTPEYVDAMWRMLQAEEPRDQVIATGVALSRRDVARYAAEFFKVDLGDRLPASGPVTSEVGDPSGIARDLGWRAFTHGRDMVRTLCEGVPA